MSGFDLRQWMFAYRSYTPIPFFIVMLLFGDPTPLTLVTGAIVGIVGELIRFWGVAIAGSETRTTGRIGGTYLITNGPFAYVRNPLYVGNMLLYAGVCIMSHALFPYLLLGVVLWFYFQYTLIVSKEEEYLADRFGVVYDNYCRQVHRFVPRLRQYRGERPPDKVFSLKEGIASERRTLQAIGLAAGVMIAKYFVGRS